MQSVFSQLALFLLVCIKNKDCFNGAVQTHWAAFVQCNIFFLFLTRTHATHTNRGVGGGISAERAHIWIDMLQFTGPRQDRGGKSIDFLPIWLRVDPGATFIFITQMWWWWWWWGVTLVLPVSMATRIIQVRGGQAAGERRIWVH